MKEKKIEEIFVQDYSKKEKLSKIILGIIGNLPSSTWGLLVLVVVASIISPHFLTEKNMFNVLRQSSVLGIVSIGMTLVIINGGIDLSVGSVLALTGIIAGSMHESGLFMVILVMLLIGIAVGFLNGYFIAVHKIEPFIVTLSALVAYRGLALLKTGGQYISGVKTFEWVGNGYVGPVPIPVIIMVVLYIVFYFIFNKTVFGREFYAVGGNEEAARLSGVNVIKNKILTYVICSVLVGFATIINISRLSIAEPLGGNLLELDAIAAVLVGGTSFAGGVGTIEGTFVGVLIFSILGNILNLLAVSGYSQMIIKGMIILGAVLLSRYRNKL